MKLYTKDHEWVKISGKIATVGISKHAADELGDITFVELPDCDDEVTKGESFAVIESVKAASEIYAPVSGMVVEVNEELEDVPETVNESPEEDGWVCKIKLNEEAELEKLMDFDAYNNFIK